LNGIKKHPVGGGDSGKQLRDTGFRSSLVMWG